MIRLLLGDVRARCADLPAGSVHSVTTSIPYYGLRSYGTPPQIWGGCQEHPHGFSALEERPPNRPKRDHAGAHGFGDTRGEEQYRAGTVQPVSQGAICDHEHEWGDPVRAPWANEVPGPNAGGKNKNRIATKEAGQVCVAPHHEHEWEPVRVRRESTMRDTGRHGFDDAARTRHFESMVCIAPCEHEWGDVQTRSGGGAYAQGERKRWVHGNSPSGHPAVPVGQECTNGCGAWLGELGLEPTFQMFIEHVREAFRAIHRVLRDDGTLWLNIGDSMAGSNNGSNDHRADGASISRSRPKYVGQKPGRQDSGAHAYGSGGRAPADSRGGGSTLSDRCDECRVALASRSPHNETPRAPESNGDVADPNQAHMASLDPSPDSSDSARPRRKRRSSRATPGQLQTPAPAAALLPAEPGRVEPGESGLQPSGLCSHCDNCGACLSVARSSSRDARLCVRRQAGTLDIGSPYGTSAFRRTDREPSSTARGHSTIGLPAKNLMLMPARVAIALQEDPECKWILRSEIVWCKTNSMPESTRSRPNNATERIFMFVKADEPTFWLHPERGGTRKKPKPDFVWLDRAHDFAESKEPPPNWQTERLPGESGPDKQGAKRWRRVNLWEGFDYFYDDIAGRQVNTARAGAPGALGEDGESMGRNLLNYWLVSSDPCPDAHFATWPREIPERTIRVGTSERGACPACGAPWMRLVERAKAASWHDHGADLERGQSQADSDHMLRGANFARHYAVPKVKGWAPTCDCFCGECQGSGAGDGGKKFRTQPGDPPLHLIEGYCQRCEGTGVPLPVPCVVLDPFGGSGRTAVAADRLNRDCVIVEIKPSYAALAHKTMSAESPMFTRIECDPPLHTLQELAHAE